jgi:hypothetical protein
LNKQRIKAPAIANCSKMKKHVGNKEYELLKKVKLFQKPTRKNIQINYAEHSCKLQQDTNSSTMSK